ncbi:MAG: cell division protein CrgA [Actinobacteria bacterium]|nr:cell division protein CrgA [Actinomycetota bacterium]MCB8996999.1 cell division protein CrgA [Actinomycetota bacterium]MCB9414010.1 cell division protein CrgA [Actinomycetota bacterium]MCB9424519.1 cell division protein CrgA [Actinomycetota bacterium]HRY08637.1 cell division protein CrgA [Candidatus Nanopelagicales bacterium]
MPESRSRRKKDQSVDKRAPVKIGSPPWVAPLMVTLFVLGLLWVVAWYIAPEAPLLGDLGFWNLVGGFVLIALGFVVSTKWR